MKKGKRLLILLLAVLTMVVAYSVTSFAASASDSYSEEGLGYAKLTADDAVYDGSAHLAELDENISGTTPSADDQSTQKKYGVVSDIKYYEVTDGSVTPCENPKDAGNYRAKVTITIHTIEGSTTTEREEELSVDYEIKKYVIKEYQWIDKNLVYNGEAQFPDVKANGADNKSQISLKPVSAKTSDECIDAGWHTAQATLSDDDAKNYILDVTSTHEYQIQPKSVEVVWMIPHYDEYGTPGEYVAVSDDDDLYLVYNGKTQRPKAEIGGDTIERDEGKVSLKVTGGGLDANTYDEDSYYTATAKLDGSRKGNYVLADAEKQFQILARPVELLWGYTPGEGAKKYANYVDPTDVEHDYDYIATYNGVKQSPFVEIVNPGVNAKGVADDITAKPELTNTPKNLYGDEIAEDRIYTDATDEDGYALLPGVLSDTTNYTYYKLDVSEVGEGGSPSSSDELVDDYEAVYNIDPYEVKELVWNANSLTKVYNASYQEPDVRLSDDDLQGPDTADQCVVMPVPADFDEAPINVGSYSFTVSSWLTFDTNVDVDRSMNYVLDEETKNLSATMKIVPAKMTVTANDNAIVYGNDPSDNGVKYAGLLNGKPDSNQQKRYEYLKASLLEIVKRMKDNYVINEGEYEQEVAGINKYFELPYNTDNVNGVPADGVFLNGEVDAKAADAIGIKFDYSKNGKPGTYSIIPYLKNGYRARNYNVNFVNGKLTVHDKVSTLVAKGTKKGSKGIKVSWNSLNGATSYDVYMSLCDSKGKKRTPKFVTTVKGNSTTIKKLNGKKLKANTCYKYYVVAKDASGNVIGKSLVGHFITNNYRGKTTNAKSMSVNKSSVTIGNGGTAKLKASYKKAKSGKKYTLNNNAHSALSRFHSENPAVATVDANGVVKGVGTGWTRVYVQGVTGMWKVVEVNVQ